MRGGLFLLLSCCLATLTLGCGGGLATYGLTGIVDLDGTPLREGEITFLPKDPKLRPGGSRIKDGNYTVELEKGTYEVKIHATKSVPLEPGEPSVSGEKEKLVSIIPERYNEKTELTVQVTGNDKKNFSLKSN